MARIRTIKPEFWTSEQIVELSTTARLLFIGLWNFCDDGGVHPANEKTLKMEVFPGDDITASQISEMIGEIKKQGLIVQYEVKNKPYWYVTGWNHQKVDRPTFKHPTPPNNIKTQDSSSPRRALDEPSATEGSVKEGKGKGREGVNAHTHEETENQKTNPDPAPPHPDSQSEPVDNHAAIRHEIFEFVKPDEFKKLRAIADREKFDPARHGTVDGEISRFIAHHLKKETRPDIIAEPVQFFLDQFPGWLRIKVEGNGNFRKSNARQMPPNEYHPPPGHRRQNNREGPISITSFLKR